MKLLAEKTKWILLLLATHLITLAAAGQDDPCLKGVVKDSLSGEPVPYATIALLNAADSGLVTGTVSNIDGEFKISPAREGRDYIIRVSHMGYKPVEIDFSTVDSSRCPYGTILINKRSLKIDKLVVVGQRIKAREGISETTYFIDEKIQKASHTGVDVLKHIPGIQVDFNRQVSLAGGSNIVVLVDGKERDMDFVRQLDAAKIEKIEVTEMPGAQYDADVTGVIHLKLKERQMGISGQMYLEAPVSRSEVYIMPHYNLQYGMDRFNFYTSYNGDIRKFDVVQKSNRSFQKTQGSGGTSSIRHLVQNEWSHRFQYGVDYYINEKNRFNFYGFYNPYSSEFDGEVEFRAQGDNMGDLFWSAEKEDTDKNAMTFYSFYYKHLFREKQAISLDMSYYNLQAENVSRYFPDEAKGNISFDPANRSMPLKKSLFMKLDFSSPLWGKWDLDAGLKSTLHLLDDRCLDAFKYRKRILAGYGQVSHKISGEKDEFSMNGGLRVEQSHSGLKDGFSYDDLAFLPHAIFNYSFGSGGNLRFSCKRSLIRPDLYQLNPVVSMDDPLSIYQGNARLKPELHEDLFLEYSFRWGGNYLSARLFHHHAKNAIYPLTRLNEDHTFETRVDNLGSITHYGIQWRGALKFSSVVTLNPSFSLLEINSRVDPSVASAGIESRHNWAFRSGVSAIVTLKHHFTASLQFQYNSPQFKIQGKSFSDPLYFLSLEKTIHNKYKVGITSGLPFTRSFTYQGSEMRGMNFHGHSQSNIRMSTFPVWLKFSYRFLSGKKTDMMQREKEQVNDRRIQGF